jgi:hypothetical protein
MLGVINPASIVELKTGKADAVDKMSLKRWRFKKQASDRPRRRTFLCSTIASEH